MKNEQKYKTPEERVEAFCKWCFNRTCESCKLKSHNFDGGDGCKFYWLALEAEEDKPGPCPFCGSETEIVSSNNTYQVSCVHCLYLSEGCTNEKSAIASHNRVSRAVRQWRKEAK